MTKLITFDSAQRDQIKFALRDHLHIADEAVQDAFVDSIEETGTLRAFGFGSLLSYSHLQESDGKFKDDLTAMFGINPADAVKTSSAKLEGYNRDFVCFDIVYRGTPEKPGITLGLDKAEGGVTSGGILETKIDHLNPNVAANFIQHYLKRFEEREYPKNMPIYTFGFLNVNAGGKSVPSLVCIADTEGPLYVHGANHRYINDPQYQIGRDDAGYKKKVHIMATAYNTAKADGSPGTKPPGGATDLDYLKNMIRDSMAKGITVEPRFHRLYSDAVTHRIRLGPEFRASMQSLERTAPELSNAPELLDDFMIAIGRHNQKVAALEPDAPLPPGQQ